MHAASGGGSGSIVPMSKWLFLSLAVGLSVQSAELPSRHYLDLSAIKSMVAGAEAEAAKRSVHVSLCIVDESGNLLYFEKADGAPLNTIQFAQKKARHAAFYGSPSKNGLDSIKAGHLDVLTLPDYFPNQGGLPVKVDGQLVGGIAASGAKSDIDEAVAQAGLDALAK